MTDEARDRELKRARLALDILAEKASLIANLKPEEYELLSGKPWGSDNPAVIAAGFDDRRGHLSYAMGVLVDSAERLYVEAVRRLKSTALPTQSGIDLAADPSGGDFNPASPQRGSLSPERSRRLR